MTKSIKTKIYDKRDDFDFDIVDFPSLDGDVPRSTSYGVYIFQLIRFARVSSHVDDLNIRNKLLTAKLLKQGQRYLKLRNGMWDVIVLIPDHCLSFYFWCINSEKIIGKTDFIIISKR